MPTGMVTMYCRTSIAAVLFVLWEFRRISHCLVPPHPTQTTNQQGNITDVTAVKFPPVFPNFSLQEFFAVKVDRKAAPLKCSHPTTRSSFEIDGFIYERIPLICTSISVAWHMVTRATQCVVPNLG